MAVNGHSASATLESLTASISDNVAKLSKLLEASKLAQPTFDEKSSDPFAGENLDVRNTRFGIVSAALDLVRLAQGPEDQILQMAWSASESTILGVLVRFDIPQTIPLGSSLTCAEVSAKVGIPEEILLRVLRFAVALGVFVEEPDGRFGHNSISARLNQNKSLRDIALTSTHELMRIYSSLPETLDVQKNAKDGNGPRYAFDVAFPGYEKGIFEYVQKTPVAAQRYHGFQSGKAQTDRWSEKNLVKGWNWSSVGSGTIVDVGGSLGHSCVALQNACPDAKFIVQDVHPGMLQKGQQGLEAQYPELAKRITWDQYDFFQPQKTTGDVYIFRHIFHDWSDEDAIKLLQNQVGALKNGAHLLVIEGVMPAGPIQRSNTIDQKHIWVEDLFMMTVHGSKERTRERYIEIFKKADPRFEFVAETGGKNGAFQSILDFVFKA